MPFKLQSKGRRHIPRQRHRVTNWREYDASLYWLRVFPTEETYLQALVIANLLLLPSDPV